ncbi:sensor histidine kinase [Acinetobacter tjernbergiae]|uniref:histidine kinase n=1 Tax=Acinetobacter tjernbergiae DSM 14971 = CIP 107465 TaxID=1120928 RepID=V2V0L0_9GAMM|nr:ATP-binding protein [Acinetobacter tjernbergiae]ESK55767.1 hypothetical protein F990_01651 [Acinetobacter tjernbergiae DSM 14971 = CIP 107465]
MHFVKLQWLKSLSFKIIFAYVVGVIFSIILVSLIAFWWVVIRSHYFASSDVAALTYEQAKNVVFDQTGTPIGFADDMEGNLSWIFDSLKQETAYRILDENGTTFLSSGADENFWRSVDIQTLENQQPFQFKNDSGVVYAATALIQNQNKNWYLQFAVSARLHYLLHRGFALPFMWLGMMLFSFVLCIVFGLCAYFTLKHTLKPLRKISESATAISPRSLHERLLVEKVPLEIVPLVEGFNRVLDRLEQGYHHQQEFLATAAHELKTPLALIRGQIELEAPSEDRQILLNDVEHMARQVQQLLLLAEVSEVQNYSLKEVNLQNMLDDVVQYLQPMANRAKIQIRIIQSENVNWQADTSALFILLKNLLENAIQHAPENTEIHIHINANQISIRDHGHGVKEDELAKLFIRFWRGAHRRDYGAGLGLSICQEIATAHGWQLTVANVFPGLCFRVSV